MIGLGSGTRRVGVGTSARYVGLTCTDGYYQAITMATVLHPQTLLAFGPADDTLPTRSCYPFKIRLPTKPGFKDPRFLTTVSITNQQPRGFWTDRGYNWFSGI